MVLSSSDPPGSSLSTGPSEITDSIKERSAEVLSNRYVMIHPQQAGFAPGGEGQAEVRDGATSELTVSGTPSSLVDG